MTGEKLNITFVKGGRVDGYDVFGNSVSSSRVMINGLGPFYVNMYPQGKLTIGQDFVDKARKLLERKRRKKK